MGKPNTNAFNIELTSQEYNLLAKLIYDRSGIDLGENKKDLVKARLTKRIRHHNFESFKQYYEYLLHDKSEAEMTEMLDAISTNVTSFFRERQHFDFMYQTALPKILNEKISHRNNRLRIWSSACATGEEPYTISMVLLDYMKSLQGWDCKVLATDISTKALSWAKEGSYPTDRIKSIPMPFIQKYFKQEMTYSGLQYSATPQLKNMISFRRLNLIGNSFPFNGTFDIIFCRNVMIYFDKKTQENLVKRFYERLNDGGYLFIGHSESLIGTNLKLKTIAPAIYQKQ